MMRAAPEETGAGRAPPELGVAREDAVRDVAGDSVACDFDGDGESDIGCYYPPGGNWYLFKSTEGFWQTTFGYAGTVPVVGEQTLATSPETMSWPIGA